MVNNMLQTEQGRYSFMRESLLALSVELQVNVDLLSLVERDRRAEPSELVREDMFAIATALKSFAHQRVLFAGLSADRGFEALSGEFQSLKDQGAELGRSVGKVLKGLASSAPSMFKTENQETRDEETDSISPMEGSKLWNALLFSSTRIDVVRQLASVAEQRVTAVSRINIEQRLMNIYRNERIIQDVIRESIASANSNLPGGQPAKPGDDASAKA